MDVLELSEKGDWRGLAIGFQRMAAKHHREYLRAMLRGDYAAAMDRADDRARAYILQARMRDRWSVAGGA